MRNNVAVIGSNISKEILRYDSQSFNLIFTSTYNSSFNSLFSDDSIEKSSINGINNDIANNSFNLLKSIYNVDYLIIDVLNELLFSTIFLDEKIENKNFDNSEDNYFTNILKCVNTINNNFEEKFELWKCEFHKFYKQIHDYSPKTKIILNKIRLTEKVFNKGILLDDYFNKSEINKLNILINEIEEYIEEFYDIKIVLYDDKLFMELDEHNLKFNKTFYHEMNSQLKNIILSNNQVIFSILIDATVNENYLKESIESILNQSLPSINIEIIIFTEKASDNTLNLIRYYKKQNYKIKLVNDYNKQYNVDYISIIKGRYFSILKSGDYYSKNTLKNVLIDFETNSVDIVSIMKKYYRNLEYQNRESKTIDLTTNPIDIQFMDRCNFIKKCSFTSILNENDDFNTLLIKLLLKNPIYIKNNLSKCFCRNKSDVVLNEEHFKKYCNLMDYSKKESGSLENIVQNIFFKELQIFLKHNSQLTTNVMELFQELDEKKVLNNQILQLSSFNEKNDKFKLKFCFTTPYNISKYSFILCDGKKEFPLNNIINLGKYQYSFNIEIPKNSNEYSIKIILDGKDYFPIIQKGNYLIESIKIKDNHYFRIKRHLNIKQNQNMLFLAENKKENRLKSFKKVHNITKHKFNFSVIIAVYNAEKYIEKTLNSIINQSINFENNIQLILVNDGSTDKSYDILLRYKEKYQNNIIVISQENSGQASARNKGLQFAEGKYINFIDSDDFVSENTFEEGLKFFTRYEDDIDVVSFPMFFFEKINGPHTLNQKYDQTKIVDLIEEPNYPQLSVSSAFIKHEAIKDKYFDINLPHAEDALLINQILLEKKKYGLLNTAKYFYRQRIEESSTTDTIKYKKDSFTRISKDFFIYLIDYCLKKENQVPLFIQYMLAYDFQWFINQPDLDIFNNIEEKNEFLNDLIYIVKHLEDKTFLENKYVSESTKAYFKYIKNNYNRTFNVVNDMVIANTGDYKYDTLNNHKIYLDIAEIKDNKLILSGILNSFVPNDFIRIYLVKLKENQIIEKYESKEVIYNTFSRKTISRLGADWQFRYNFDVEVPLYDENSCFKFIIEYDDYSNKTSFDASITIVSNFGLSSVSSYMISDSKILSFKNNIFYIKPYSYKMMFKHEIDTLKGIFSKKEKGYLEAIIIRLIYLLIYPLFKNKRIWLFSDHVKFADDNATHLFKYSIKQKDNIIKYFVIDKNSSDFKKMKQIDRHIVGFGTLKHKLLFLLSENSIYSYQNINFRNPFHDKKFKLYTDLITNKRNFLQHGVTIGDISEFHNKARTNLSLLVTVSDEEKKSFSKEGYNFDENVVQILGFPRYDNLRDKKTKKQILFLPTWRNNIIDEKTFINSKYYEVLQSFLNNKKLHKILNENGYQLVFRPHPEFIKYEKLFNVNDNIKMSIDVTEESYQDLFMESALLITDYSSVAFDFAYLKKPVIYYQFSDDYHYEKGYFNFETMGFGQVICDEELLINKIEEYIINSCNMDERYINRVEDFFKYTDKNNSKRVYEWLFNKKN